MNLLDLPVVVIEGHLLPFLQWNDLLRFRRVCKDAKATTDGYLQVNPDLTPEIEINEEDKTFEAFLELGIPTKKVYLKNTSGYQFYVKEAEDIGRFLERYGPLIVSLRVDQLSLLVFGKELDFLEALTNLQNLEIGGLRFQAWDDASQSKDELFEAFSDHVTRAQRDDRVLHSVISTAPVAVPNVIKQLKVLQIGQQPSALQAVRKFIDQTGLHFLATNETSLDYVAIPFLSHAVSMDSPVPEELQNPDPMCSMKVVFKFIAHLIDTRARETTQEIAPIAKVIDFVNFRDSSMPIGVPLMGARPFQDLCHVCVKHGIKLRNVSPVWFMHHQAYGPAVKSSQVGIPVISLVGLHPCVISAEMPNLERIQIECTSLSGSVGSNWKQERKDWPALKYLDITVNSVYFVHDEGPGFDIRDLDAEDTSTLFHFFFKDVLRSELVEISLTFVDEKVDIPKAKDVVKSCPNLKKLTLVNWPGTNKALIELFGGLPGLEEVSLESCKNVGNVTFVGTDTSDPVFLKLKKLRKLSLKGLDKMPKITDLLFTIVIRHLNLSHLTLTSDTPVNSVTCAGIRALLEGNFAQSIEKFSFKHFSLEGVSSLKLQELQKQFRSYDML